MCVYMCMYVYICVYVYVYVCIHTCGFLVGRSDRHRYVGNIVIIIVGISFFDGLVIFSSRLRSENMYIYMYI